MSNEDKKSSENCLVDMGEQNIWYCYRRANGHLKDGTPVCGIHLRAEINREKKTKEYRERAKVKKEFAEKVKWIGEENRISSLRLHNFEDKELIISASDLDLILSEAGCTLWHCGTMKELFENE